VLDSDLDKLATASIDELKDLWDKTPDAERTSFHYVIRGSIFAGQDPSDWEAYRQELVADLKELRGLHAELKSKFGKTMRTDTVFGIDYYPKNEDSGKKGQPISEEPQFYGTDVRSGDRGGFYKAARDYFDRYQMPMMTSESGTTFYYPATKWHMQMVLEEAKAAEAGIPMLAHTMYPAVDTKGWEYALSGTHEKSMVNPAGIMTLEYKPRRFVQKLVESLGRKLKK
jgi:hypothetical protein